MARTQKRVRGVHRVPPPYNPPDNDCAAGAVPSPPGLLNQDTVGVNEDTDNDVAEVNNNNLNDEEQGTSPENECEENLEKDASNKPKQDNPGADENKEKQEAKQPHDDDPTAAALDSKVDEEVGGPPKKSRRRYSKAQKIQLIASIQDSLQSAKTKTCQEQIIKNHDVDPSSYYKWIKQCIVCQVLMKTVSKDGVVCPNKSCQVRLCHECFSKHFIRKLSITKGFRVQVNAVDCGWCTNSVVVCELGDHQPTRTFKKDRLCQALLRQSNQGVEECEQLLGKLTRDLSGFRHDLIGVVESVTEDPFTQVESTTVSSFAQFISKYHGSSVADCEFVAKMKDVIRVSRWLNFRKVDSMNTQIGNLKKIHAQFVGVRALMVDLAVLCHISAVKRQRMVSTKSLLLYIKLPILVICFSVI